MGERDERDNRVRVRVCRNRMEWVREGERMGWGERERGVRECRMCERERGVGKSGEGERES